MSFKRIGTAAILVNSSGQPIDCSTCPCGAIDADVLIWRGADSNDVSAYTDLIAVWEGMGLTVHTQDTWTGNINHYNLIYFPQAISDPSWWSAITGNTWNGRLHITAEGLTTNSDDSIAYVDSLSTFTGISVLSTAVDRLCNFQGSVEADDLTSGMGTFFEYGDTTLVTGGTPLSLTFTSSQAWIARNKPSGSNIDFVVSGDVNHASDHCSQIANNQAFFENLWNVPI